MIAASQQVPTIIKNSDILKALLQLSNNPFRLSSPTAKLSTLMKQDLTTTWEAATNKNALLQSIQTQVDLETKYATNNNHEQLPHPIMPLVIFIPADADSSKTLLQSKSCMDCFIEELKNPNSIHLICLGKECDFDSTSAATTSTSRDGDPNRNDPLESRGFSPSTNSNTKQPANTLQLLQAMQNAFSSNSNNAPPGFFPQHNNDPEGYQRFNIILARTVDENGNPGIMGAVSPGNVNIFPSMVALMQQKEYQQRQQRQQAGDNAGNNNNVQTNQPPPWGMPTHWQANPLPGMQIPTGVPFVNASIHISGMAMNSNPDGRETNSNNMWGGLSNNNHPPPEVIQRAMEMAITQVVERLAGNNDGGEVQGNFPPQLQSAFSNLLSNENTRRELVDKLSKVAPALLNPGCPMVMLSVLCAPTRDGSTTAPSPFGVVSKEESAVTSTTSDGNSNTINTTTDNMSSSSTSVGGKGNWLQKILSVAPSTIPPGSGSDSGANSENEHIEDGAASPAEAADRAKGIHMKGQEKLSKSNGAGSSSKPLGPNIGKPEQPDKAHAAFLKRTRSLRKLESLCQINIPLSFPHDPIKKKLWVGWIARQNKARIYRKNKTALKEVLSSSGLQLEKVRDATAIDDDAALSPALKAMLGMKDCTDQMYEVVHVAIELEAESNLRNLSMKDGEHSFRPLNGNQDESSSIAQFGQTIKSSSMESAMVLVCGVSPHAESSGVEGFRLPGAAFASPKPHPTREDLYQLAADKHERALCNNIIFPENIGVTYEQIGGLDEVKELLRQSITYPLKYPSLYSKVIARESCKGVLLFGACKSCSY